MVDSCVKERKGGLLLVKGGLVVGCEECGKEEGRVSVVVGLVGGGSCGISSRAGGEMSLFSNMSL